MKFRNENSETKLRGAEHMNTRKALFSGTPDTNVMDMMGWTKGCCEFILHPQCRVCEQEKGVEFDIINRPVLPRALPSVLGTSI